MLALVRHHLARLFIADPQQLVVDFGWLSSEIEQANGKEMADLVVKRRAVPPTAVLVRHTQGLEQLYQVPCLLAQLAVERPDRIFAGLDATTRQPAAFGIPHNQHPTLRIACHAVDARTLTVGDASTPSSKFGDVVQESLP